MDMPYKVRWNGEEKTFQTIFEATSFVLSMMQEDQKLTLIELERRKK
jgi:hypothetical protein